MCTKKSTMKSIQLLCSCLAVLAVMGLQSQTVQAQECNGLVNLQNNVSGGPNWADVGDVRRVRIRLGTGDITGGSANEMTVNRLKLNMDCNAGNLGITGCVSDSSIVTYEGNLTTANCVDTNGDPILSWTSSHAAGDATPNQVVFTPAAPAVMAANQAIGAASCQIEFDIKVVGRSDDTTPWRIEQSAGYDDQVNDASCDNGLNSGGLQTAAIPVCPECDNGLYCDGLETCDQTLPVNTTAFPTNICTNPADVVCPDTFFCAEEFCNESIDACDTRDISTTVCPDNLFCADVACDEVNNECDTTDRSTTVCPDNLFCADVACDEVNNECDTTDRSTTVCPDNLFCADVTCDEVNNECDTTDTSTTVCPDNLFCADVACDEANNECDTTDRSTTVCPDNLFCADVACDEVNNECDTTDRSTTVCPDNEFCADVTCDEANNECDTTDTSTTVCPDNLFCADVACDEVNNECDTTDTSTTVCPDNLYCADVACDEANDECDTTDTSTTVCPDNEFCADVTCDEANDECDTTDTSTMVCPDTECTVCDEGTDECVPNGQCGVEICRTPGYWGTHAGTEKGARNITKTVIDECGGCLEVCGDVINNTNLNNADSSVEAMCVSIQGNKRLQLVRQLTAAALNCCISGSDDSCDGISVNELYDACNTVCAANGGVEVELHGHIVNCIDAIDCFNNGGRFDMETGYCGDAGENNCHNREFGICPNGDLCDFETPCVDGTKCSSPAGSSNKCNDANKNTCKVVGSPSGCGSGTNGAETCVIDD